MKAQDRVRALLEREGFAETCADVDLTYGGTWVRDNGDTFDAIEIVDLESACGADGQLCVIAHRCGFDYLDGDDWRAVYSCMDTRSSLHDIAKRDKQAARCMLAYDVIHYGLGDELGHYVAVFDLHDAKEAREVWSENRVYGWGYAALTRAIENAVSKCNGFYWAGAYHPVYDGADVRKPAEAETR